MCSTIFDDSDNDEHDGHNDDDKKTKKIIGSVPKGPKQGPTGSENKSTIQKRCQNDPKTPQNRTEINRFRNLVENLIKFLILSLRLLLTFHESIEQKGDHLENDQS